MKKMTVKQGFPYPMGITSFDQAMNVSVSMEGKGECGILLYHKSTKEEQRIVFSNKYRIGTVYCVLIEGITPEDYEYNFFEGEKIKLDPYARRIAGHEEWARMIEKDKLKGVLVENTFDWGADRLPKIAYEKCVFYCMHVRGFTRHSSSGVKYKGTFHGIVEKIPYLKELGITSVEILPAYEFDEIEVPRYGGKASMLYMVSHYKEVPETGGGKDTPSVNYWGFKEGYYFTPKAAYTQKGIPPSFAMKQLVKELHQNKMELIMQFYFPKTTTYGFILDVLRFWVMEYHIDGCHLMGENIPLALIATDPILTDTKLMYYDFPCDEIYQNGLTPEHRNLASYDEKFMIDIRKFLKSDEDMLQRFLFQMKNNPAKKGTINFITNYYGYTLMDLVSFDKKHNEMNGEENKDGNNYNYSWNCGVEGKTRKKAVLELRMRQIKNALILLILAQGTPVILSGDEFGNSQKGNNNPYCQDNLISWLNWNDLKKNQEIFAFIKKLLQLRKEHPILRRKTECRIMDTIACGYPDLSYHGEEVWRPAIDNYNRHIAIMYCGKYESDENGREDEFFYIAYNMHWEEHEFSLPKLPKGKRWTEIISTSAKDFTDKMKDRESKIVVAPRSIKILMSTINKSKINK